MLIIQLFLLKPLHWDFQQHDSQSQISTKATVRTLEVHFKERKISEHSAALKSLVCKNRYAKTCKFRSIQSSYSQYEVIILTI